MEPIQSASWRSRGIAPFTRALATGVVAIVALSRLPQFPVGVSTVLVAICALAALASVKAGVTCTVLVLSYPLIYVNPTLGFLFLIAGIAAMPFLSLHDGAPFFLLAGTILALAARAEWAIPVLAGFYLGTTEGVVVGLAAAVGIEVAGFLVGERFLGTVFANGSREILKLTSPSMPPLTDFGWIVPRFRVLPPGRLGTELAQVAASSAAIIIQPLVWGAAAGVTGAIARLELKRAMAGIAAGMAVLFVGHGMALSVLGTAEGVGGLLVSTLAVSTVVAVFFVIATLVFKQRFRAPAVASYAVTASQAPVAEQAPQPTDVVDLLRTISWAEEEIRQKYTQDATILLTDMKEFSKMTSEKGSIPSATTVQMHRDLLMPVIQANGGSAQATGGDGIMAAFADARTAIQAAVDMQNTLAHHNATHGGDKQVLVRVGINTGEVVFDNEGTPFIGDGVNAAARVMGLADGGQILLTKSALESALDLGDFRWQYLGTRDLKGVAVGAHIYEILWHQGAPQPEPTQGRS